MFKEFLLMGLGSLFAPGVGYAGVIHPFVEEFDVGHVHCFAVVEAVGLAAIGAAAEDLPCGRETSCFSGGLGRIGTVVGYGTFAEGGDAEGEILF